MAEFFHMGGYGVYVWSAYAIWLAVMVVNVVLPIIKARGTIKRLARAFQDGGNRP